MFDQTTTSLTSTEAKDDARDYYKPIKYESDNWQDRPVNQVIKEFVKKIGFSLQDRVAFHHYLAVIGSRGIFESAGQKLSRYSSKTELFSKEILAWINFGDGNYKITKKICLDIIKTNEKLELAHLILGKIALVENRPDLARSYFEKLKESKPKSHIANICIQVLDNVVSNTSISHNADLIKRVRDIRNFHNTSILEKITLGTIIFHAYSDFKIEDLLNYENKRTDFFANLMYKRILNNFTPLNIIPENTDLNTFFVDLVKSGNYERIIKSNIFFDKAKTFARVPFNFAILSEDPKNLKALSFLLRVYSNSSNKDADIKLRYLVKLSEDCYSNNFRFLNSLAAAYLKLKLYDKCTITLEKAESFSYNDSFLKFTKARLDIATGNYGRAHAYLASLLKNSTATPNFKTEVAICYFNLLATQSKFKESIGFYDQYLGDRNHKALEAKSEVLLKLNKFEKIIHDYNNIIFKEEVVDQVFFVSYVKSLLKIKELSGIDSFYDKMASENLRLFINKKLANKETITLIEDYMSKNIEEALLLLNYERCLSLSFDYFKIFQNTNSSSESRSHYFLALSLIRLNNKKEAIELANFSLAKYPNRDLQDLISNI